MEMGVRGEENKEGSLVWLMAVLCTKASEIHLFS